MKKTWEENKGVYVLHGISHSTVYVYVRDPASKRNTFHEIHVVPSKKEIISNLGGLHATFKKFNML